MGQSNNVDKSIRDGYRKAVLADITEEKLKALKELYNSSISDFREKPKNIKEFIPFETDTDANLAALTVVANAIMNLDEFLTKS
jgi:hypothetical protein